MFPPGILTPFRGRPFEHVFLKPTHGYRFPGRPAPTFHSSAFRFQVSASSFPPKCQRARTDPFDDPFDFTDGDSPDVTFLSRQLWTYLLHHSELKNSEIEQIVQSTIPNKRKRNFMSTAQRLKLEGRQEGRQEGIGRGRQEAIIKLLKIRHKRVPPGLLEAVAEVSDERHLERLFLAAAQSATIEKFSESL